MILTIVRHGHTENNARGIAQGHLDSELDALGLWQAERVARALAQAPVGCLYSSDLKRCLQTAAPLARALNLAVTPTELLRERSLGMYEGRPITELVLGFERARATSSESLFDLAPGGCETARAVYERIQRFLTTTHFETDTAIFTHGMTAEVLVCALIGAPVESSLSLSFANGSITRLSWTGLCWHLDEYNFTGHLEDM